MGYNLMMLRVYFLDRIQRLVVATKSLTYSIMMAFVKTEFLRPSFGLNDNPIMPSDERRPGSLFPFIDSPAIKKKKGFVN